MLQIVISFIFYITFIIYILLGIYSITLNMKESLNRVFLFLCLCFSIWAFAFALSNSSNNYEEVLFWRRGASLGWGVAFSVIVHFILILTGESNALKRKWIVGLIYLPAAINVFIFGLYSKVANKQYNLVHTIAGWGNIPLNNFGDLYYNGYYLSFSLVTLVLLIRWYRKSDNLEQKKNALYLTISFVISLVLGSISEMLVNSILTFKIPSIAPIIILIPVATIFYIIQKHGLMSTYGKKKLPLEGIILSDHQHSMFIRYIAIVFFIGCMLNLLHYFFYSTQLISVMLFSTLFLLMGLLIFVLPYLGLSIKLEDLILTIVLVISIPLMIFSFQVNYASNIVWPIPLIFMMITIIFNNKKMFLMIAVTSLVTGIWAWVRVPELVIKVGSLDYIARIVLYGMGIILAAYINKTYILRLKENDRQVQFQKMISQISTNLVTITSSNFDEKIRDLLEKSGCYTHADRSYLGMFAEDQQRINFTHEWLEEGIRSVIEHHKELLITPFPWFRKQLLANQIVFISAEVELPLDAKSLIFIPISNKDKVIGFIGFDQISDQSKWRIEEPDLLRVLANLLADAITKVEVEKEMNYLAYYDNLTGLPNRTLFSNRLDQTIHLAKRSEKLIGMIFMDLDGFKAVNDTLGHDWGDNLLKQVGDRLSQCIRKYDTVARFGGDEFLIMIPQISQMDDVEEVAKKVMEIFNRPILVNGQEFFITASGGIAVFPVDGEEGNILIKNAELAMYYAKNNGKSQYAFCSSSMKADVINQMTLTNSLYRALDRNELVLNFQPQVSAETNEIIGVEALVRWNHSELGRIMPSIFIPIAEQTGLIHSIGEWVLKTACRQNKAWQEMGFKPFKIAINISVEQFRSGDLLHIVKECLEETDLDPRYLELEITEGIVMKDSHDTIKLLQELKALGITIAIDDFGAEYSSLSRLKDLPVDCLKIDKQFIQGISKNSKDESIITVISHLGRRLGLKVIALGVETEIQLKFLTKGACHEVQGCYFYEPMSKEEIEKDVLTLSY